MIRSLSLRRGRLLAALAVVLLTGTAQANLLTNGSFELGGVGLPPPSPPSLPGDPFLVVNTGDNATLYGWSVSGAVGVDWIQQTYWQAADGEFSLDINALGAGTISQSFATVAGGTYTVSYALSMNPDTNNTFPINRIMTVAATDDGTNTVVGSTVHNEPFNSFGSTYTNMNWQTQTLTFTATGTSTTLSFASDNDYAGGFALDNISVTGTVDPNPVPAPAGLLLGLFGAAVGLRYRRRKVTAAV